MHFKSQVVNNFSLLSSDKYINMNSRNVKTGGLLKICSVCELKIIWILRNYLLLIIVHLLHIIVFFLEINMLP